MRHTVLIPLLLFFSSVFAQNYDWTTKFEASNFLETVTYEECISFSKQLAETSPMIHYTEIGKSPQQRAIPMLIIDKDGLSESWDIYLSGRKVLLVQAGIHAGEPDGTDAMFLLLRDMVVHQKKLDLLEHVSILFIPSFNVDGLARMGPYNRINQNGPKEMGWRTNSRNLNLNRDYMKADSPEMKAWLKIFNEYNPYMFIDCHTTDGADYQYIATYALETFGNMDDDLTHFTKDIYEPYLVRQLEKKGTPIFPYVTFRQWHDPRSGLVRKVGTPMISQGYTALRNRIGLLIETHMLKPYKPRVFATKDMIVATLEIMNQHYKELHQLNSVAGLTNGDKQGLKELTIKYKVDYTDTSYVDFLGVEYDVVKSDLTGGDWFQYSDKKTTFKLPLFEKQIAAETVQLPLAYIVPVEYQDVQELLIAHGLQYDITTEKHVLHIDTYKFSNQRWNPSSFEGRQMLSQFDMEQIKKEITFDSGAMVLPVHQPGLKVLVYLLEPKADNSLVSWGFFNSSMERKEYAETYVMEKMAREMIAKDPSLLEEFKQWKADNPGVEKNQWAQTMWFFAKTNYWDQKKDIYPVGIIRDKNLLKQMDLLKYYD